MSINNLVHRESLKKDYITFKNEAYQEIATKEEKKELEGCGNFLKRLKLPE